MDLPKPHGAVGATPGCLRGCHARLRRLPEDLAPGGYLHPSEAGKAAGVIQGGMDRTERVCGLMVALWALTQPAHTSPGNRVTLRWNRGVKPCPLLRGGRPARGLCANPGRLQGIPRFTVPNPRAAPRAGHGKAQEPQEVMTAAVGSFQVPGVLPQSGAPRLTSSCRASASGVPSPWGHQALAMSCTLSRMTGSWGQGARGCPLPTLHLPPTCLPACRPAGQSQSCLLPSLSAQLPAGTAPTTGVRCTLLPCEREVGKDMQCPAASPAGVPGGPGGSGIAQEPKSHPAKVLGTWRDQWTTLILWVRSTRGDG